MSLIGRLFGKDTGMGVDELARRLGVPAGQLRALRPSYTAFEISKRAGGRRQISAPSPELKDLQRRILHRVLGKLRVHASVTGFERGYSIVSNAYCHAGRAVVVRMDVQNFFPATAARRVHAYFRFIGWNQDAAKLLERLCTENGGLPQGAPTSPRLSNLVNFQMDARLAGLASKHGAVYTRYADDITFSFDRDDPHAVRSVIRRAKEILRDTGYKIHHKRKLHIRRRHQRQVVTGLVVNERVALPRAVRRRLRAMAHHEATGRPCSLDEAQRQGWRAYGQMVERQRDQLA